MGGNHFRVHNSITREKINFSYFWKFEKLYITLRNSIVIIYHNDRKGKDHIYFSISPELFNNFE